MQIIPAMDIISGKCVRLSKGDFSTEKVYSDNPVEMAKAFEGAGLERLHIVDLEGAKAGSITNLKVLESVAGNTRLTIDFGGGIKTLAEAESVYNAGAAIITLGSIAVKSPGLVADWIDKFGADKILIGADVLNKRIKINGWQEDGGTDIMVFLETMIGMGVENVFCTDISKDGMMEGPSTDLYKEIIHHFTFLNVIASGGVSGLKDLYMLKETGCSGAIVGKAFYEGAVTLEELSLINGSGKKN